MHYSRFGSTLLATVAGMAVASCGADEIYRKVTLAPSVSLPTGRTMLAGDTLLVQFGAVEPLAMGHRFVVWAGTASGPVALGESDAAGTIAATLTDFGLVAIDIQLIIVSEEEEGTGLPSTLLGSLYLQGLLVDGELRFGGLDAADLEATTGEAELLDEEITLETMGLPSLPGGFSYAVWMMFPDDGAMEMIEMGELGGDGTLEASGDRILALGRTIAVTVESDNGMPMMSNSTVLTGRVVTEAQGSTAPAEESGDHMH